MTNKTWHGTIDSNYANAGNWTGGAPATGDVGVFGPNATTKLVTIAVATLTANGWTFTGGAYDIQLTAAFELAGAGISVSAGSAFIESLAGGDLIFKNSSSAGSATLEAISGGTITFQGTSTGGTARLIVGPGSMADFSAGAGPGGNGNVAGSIEGGGTFNLGGRPLTVGGNNRSSLVTGDIVGGPGSALSKVGTGTLTLAGNNTFTGAIALEGGVLDLASSGADFGGLITMGAGRQTLRVENAALSVNDFAPLINSFGAGDTIDLPGLPFLPGAMATYNTAFQTLSVTSGATTITFDSVAVAGAITHFAALGDHGGGTRVVLAIVGTAGNNLIDGTHVAAGPRRPTNGPDVILGLDGNDTLKGLGGSDILVGGAGKDRLFGGTQADSFVFQTIADSKPARPDVIMDFSHAQHDKIDLYDIDADQRGAAPGNQAFVFIGAQTFAHYHHLHPTVFGMVRLAGGVLQGNVNGNLAPDVAIVVPGVHAGDLVL
jgi:autotransporter-associated beta strand protein